MARNGRYAMLFALLAALGVGLWGCGDRPDERAALERDELERELDLALGRDTVPATFQDTVIGPEPVPAPGPEAPVEAPAPPRPQQAQPRPQAPRQQLPEPRPAPQSLEPRQPRATTQSVPAGTTFAVRLNEMLATDRNRPGDGFTATVTDPIVAADGSVLIPAGATLRGRVTAVEASGRVGETAVIKLAFEAVSFGGESYPLQGSVVEANPERRTRQTTREQGAKVAAGAAAGAMLGRVLGRDAESTLKGAVIGAAAGTAIAMGTADVDAVLPQGSRMVIRLDAPVQVTRQAS
jgi:hypothetical protein